MRGVHSPGDVLTLTAPSGGVTSGRAYKIGQVIAIAMVSAAEGASFSALINGAVFVDKVSAQAWTEGAFIYWDDTAKLFTTVSSGNTPAGIAAATAANPSIIGVVRLGLALATGGGGGTPAGDTGAVQFNDGGAFGGDADNLFWDTAGGLRIGPAADDFYSQGTDALFVVDDNAGAHVNQIKFMGFDSRLQLHFWRASGSIALPTAVTFGDIIGHMEFGGYDGSDMIDSAAIFVYVDAAPGAGSVPTAMQFMTGTAFAVERVRLDSKGGMTLVEEFANGADPDNPASGGRLFCIQTGGGKTQIGVRFPSGATQIIATEP